MNGAYHIIAREDGKFEIVVHSPLSAADVDWLCGDLGRLINTWYAKTAGGEFMRAVAWDEIFKHWIFVDVTTIPRAGDCIYLPQRVDDMRPELLRQLAKYHLGLKGWRVIYTGP
jgi:hypothetical protein